MARSCKIFGFLLVTLLGAYGCAKVPSSPTTEASSSSAAKIQRLEDDYRSAITIREQLRQKLVAAEEQAARSKKQLEQQLEEARVAAAAERDTLRAEVKVRTGERDALQAQYDGFRKTLREMIGSADATVSKLNLPAPATEPTAATLGAVRN